MQAVVQTVLPILFFLACILAMALVLLGLGRITNPQRPSQVKRMPYESGMNPVHDTRRRFDVRFHLLAIAFLVFDVELLFLYPWAVVLHPAKVEGVAVVAPAAADPRTAAADGEDRLGAEVRPVFAGGMVFMGLLLVGLVYDWRKGVFLWR